MEQTPTKVKSLHTGTFKLNMEAEKEVDRMEVMLDHGDVGKSDRTSPTTSIRSSEEEEMTFQQPSPAPMQRRSSDFFGAAGGCPFRGNRRSFEQSTSRSKDGMKEGRKSLERSKRMSLSVSNGFHSSFRGFGDTPLPTESEHESRMSLLLNVSKDSGDGMTGCPFRGQATISEGEEADRRPSLDIIEDVFGHFYDAASESNEGEQTGDSKGVMNESEDTLGLDSIFTTSTSKVVTEEDLFSPDNSTANGHFSREYGFLISNYDQALEALRRTKGRIWLDLGKRMAGLMSNNGMIQAVDNLEIVEAETEHNCPTQSLQIACSVLAHLWNGYRAECWRNNIVHEAPPSLQIPWAHICRRLGRHDVYFAVEDVINNCRPIYGGDNFEVDNLEMMSPLWKSSAELVISKLFCSANHYFKEMLPSILALARGEWEARHIQSIINALAGLQKMMGKAIPDGSAGANSIDPVEFATAFANSTAPTKEGVPGFSGGGVPVFICLDQIIGRKTYSTFMGKDNLVQIKWMPPNWQRFILYLRQQRIHEHAPDDLKYLWTQMKDAYIGDRGWLGRHKYRAYQFVELSGALGRASNKGSSSGRGALEMLEDARHERDPSFCSDRSSYKTCLFKGTIAKVTRVSDDRLTQLVTITTAKPVFLNLGDHVAIVMKNNDDRIWKFAVQNDLDLKASLSVHKGTLSEEWKERLDFDRLDHSVYNVLRCAKLSAIEKHGSKTILKERLDLTNICRLLHPEEPRLYSFANINPRISSRNDGFTSFELVVTRTGEGGCSAFLFDSIGEEVAFGLSNAFKFSLPESKPIVVIAAGSGLGTYMPVLINDEITNPKYAFLAFRTEHTVPYLRTHFKEAVAYNKMQLFVELSREEKTLVTHQRKLNTKKTKKRYLDSLMKEQAALLRELAAPIEEGGMEATFYVCGNSAFFSTVSEALEQIEPGAVAALVEENRLHLEVQARGGIDGDENAPSVSLSEMCFHNKMGDFWTAIHGKVYDFTSYLAWHPGGRKILHYIAGTDCSEQWDMVSHGQDRMVYSQLQAYEVGPFVAVDSPLESYLELITRAENCVGLYREDNLFNNLCDSYGKVQNMMESVFGSEFLELCLHLEQPTWESVVSRVWFVLHGRERVIADNMYKVAPLREAKEQKGFTKDGDSIEFLRPASSEERAELKKRIMKASDHFFLTCKTAVAEVLANQENTEMNLTEHPRMFFRIVLAFEQFYSSLAQPLPLSSLRKWGVVRSELKLRKTFFLRFPRNTKSLDEDFSRLVKARPDDEVELLDYLDELCESMQKEAQISSRVDRGKATNTVNEWLENRDAVVLFNKLDTDNDGLISADDFVSPHILNELTIAEREFMASFTETEIFESQDTFCFTEFLEGDEKIRESRKMHRVSTMMFKASRPGSTAKMVG